MHKEHGLSSSVAIAVVLVVIAVASVFGFVYSLTSQQQTSTTFLSERSSLSIESISTSNSPISSENAWTLSNCGVHTITATTTSTEYFANTTFTTTMYWLTPNVLENNSTTYTSGNSTIASFTSYNATTTATSSSSFTTTYTTTRLCT